MTQLARLIAGAALALSLATGAAPALESPKDFSLFNQSVTGSFLAGRQALSDLRTEDAARYLRDAAAIDWDNPIVVERAFIALTANGQIADAAELGRHLIDISGPNDLAQLVLGTEALKREDYEGAIEALGVFGGDTFAGITGGILHAWALAGEGDIAGANAVLDGIAEGSLEDFMVFHRALMADVAGRSDEAIGFAARAYESDPQIARIVEAYTRMLGNAGRFDEAAEVIAAFEAEGLTHPLVDAVKAAIENKERPGPFATNVQAGAAEMFHSVGTAIAREGSPEIAAMFLQLGIYLDPDADVIDLMLAQLLDSAGQHAAANLIYDRLPTNSPMKPTAVIRIAENLDAMGNRDEALRRLGNIVALNPRDVEALSVLGDLQRTAELYGDAAETYTRAIEASGGEAPGHWRFYYVRGIAYERNKEWPKAEADFQHALALNPDQPQVLNYLGYSWVDQGINLLPALEMIEKAVAAAPNDGYIVDSLGWAYYRLGRFEEAVQALELAVRLRSTDPEINDHLGDAYWRAGRQLEARFQWNIAASVDEEGNVTARVADKLANGLPPLAPGEDPGDVAEGSPVTAQ